MKKVLCILFGIVLLLTGCGGVSAETCPSVEPTAVPAEISTEAARIITENELGTVDGYDYELWKDRGTTEMELLGEGCFRCDWKDINNALFRIGRKFDCTKAWQEVGTITVDYGADYFPVGNSYLCVYGWTREPLVEF